MGDNGERIMEDIIARGKNTVPAYIDEECSQANGFLNIHMTEGGDVATEDLENNEDDIAVDSENNEDLEDDNVSYHKSVRAWPATCSKKSKTNSCLDDRPL
jgi:hypothetical protein